MRFLIVGLGSMGRRRIRNLRHLGESEIAGFDQRADRRKQIEVEYGVPTWDTMEQVASAFEPEVVIVSTSPESHRQYVEWAVSRGLDCFVEASVSSPTEGMKLVRLAATSDRVIVPSCTMVFTDAVMKVKELLAEGVIGKPLVLNYHVGQYLPDWHPWERVEDYYVSQRETGGCREIVPFEFTWLSSIFGVPIPLSGLVRRLGNMDIDIDDYYHAVVEFPNHLVGTVTVEVLSQPKATRQFWLIGSEGRISFDNDSFDVKTVVGSPTPGEVIFSKGEIEPGYIYPEGPYVRELQSFLDAVRLGDPSRFPNDFSRDLEMLKLLADVEALSA